MVNDSLLSATVRSPCARWWPTVAGGISRPSVRRATTDRGSQFGTARTEPKRTNDQAAPEYPGAVPRPPQSPPSAQGASGCSCGPDTAQSGLDREQRPALSCGAPGEGALA